MKAEPPLDTHVDPIAADLRDADTLSAACQAQAADYDPP
jgi:hypothetical protein